MSHRKNDFAEGSKILLDTGLKIILLGHQNTFVGILKIISNAAKNFHILQSKKHFVFVLKTILVKIFNLSVNLT